MEKISNIVRGSSRVASTDLKSAPAVRPGAPSFGRPVGESPSAPERAGTTASRAVALHSEMEQKRANSKDGVVAEMADQFFMSRIRRPDDEGEGAIPGVDGKERGEDEVSANAVEGELKQPSGFKPRGSYVDVHA